MSVLGSRYIVCEPARHTCARPCDRSARSPECVTPGQWSRTNFAALRGLVQRAEDRDESYSTGQAMQNGHIESVNGRFRDECLNANWFRNLLEARRKIKTWRDDYNRTRPHSSLGYRTPNEFTAQWRRPSSWPQRIPQPEPLVKAALSAHSRAALTNEPGCSEPTDKRTKGSHDNGCTC